MLKAKNIIIIFVLNYLLILLACCFLELIFIGSKAQEVQLLMRTAADMALEQVQATDDFFTTGGGYIMNGNELATDVTPYQLNALGINGKYKQVNMFEAVTNKKDLDEIFKTVYSPAKIQEFIDNNPNSLEVCFTAGIVEHNNESDGFGIYNGDANNIQISLKTNWYQVPMLAQLGSDIVGTKARFLYKMDGNKVLSSTGGANDPISQIWTMYDLKESRRKMALNNSEVHYYLTPLSLGITYINEDLLQAFFMNNLELLMRSKYITRADYNLNSEECGNGILKGTFYPELTDTKTLQSFNPINNGSFTLLRGQRMGSTDMSIELYKGIMPKIEYLVIDMYSDDNDSNSLQNQLLQQIFGPRFSGNSENASFSKRAVTGKLLKDMNADSIQNIKSLTGGGDSYNHKPIIVAKVTFYADFIVPYSTVSLREMRGRIDNNIISGRTLFNPFSYSQVNIENVQPIQGNYVDINSPTLLEQYPQYSNKIYNENGVNRLGGNSDAMTYTTYFAVTP